MLRTLCALFATLVLVAGPVRAADPYEIHVITNLTGGGSFIGQAGSAALKVFEASVNASGGIRGRPLHFVFQDDTTNPQLSVQIAQSLLDQTVVFDLATAASCGAILPLLKNGPVHYCVSNGVHPPPGSFMFTSAMWSSAMIDVDLRYFRERGLTKIGLITSTDASGQDAERSIDETLTHPENTSIKIVAREHFNPTDITVDAQMSRIKAAGPNLLIAWSTGTPLGTLLRGIQTVGVTIPVLTTAGNLQYAQMKQYASILPPEIYFAGMPSFAPEAVTDRGTKAALATYFKIIHDAGLTADYSTMSVWDPAALIVAALRKFGTDAKPEQIRAYFAGLKGWTGVDGVYDFPAYPQRGLGEANVLVIRWDGAKQTWVGVSRTGGTPLAQR